MKLPTLRSRCKTVAAVAITVAATVLPVAGARAGLVTVTLNLNSLPTGRLSGPVTVDGFTISPNGASYTKIVNVNGTNTLQSSDSQPGSGTGDILTMAGGGTFSLVSVALADAGNNGAVGINIENALTGVGFSYGSGYASNANYGGPLTSTFTTYNYSTDSEFQNGTQFLIGIVDYNSGDAVENITVSYTSTPEPASLTLLGAGVAGVGWLRRRKAGPGAEPVSAASA
jgi:hypothetical protein